MKIHKIKKDTIKYCTNALQKFWGLRMTKKFGKHKTLLFTINKGEYPLIDMFFVFHTIRIAWLDKNYKVLDTTIAKPFRIYAPKTKEEIVYFIETTKETKIEKNDKIKIIT